MPQLQILTAAERAEFETPVGTFRPLRLAKEHYSQEWDDAPMPHSIFFTDRGTQSTAAMPHAKLDDELRMAVSDSLLRRLLFYLS